MQHLTIGLSQADHMIGAVGLDYHRLL